MKDITPYIRIRNAQRWIAERKRQFKIQEALIRRIAETLKEQENADNFQR